MPKITETYENGLTRTYETKPCSSCETDTDPLELFPRDLCLACYKQTAEATRLWSAEELAKAWGA